MRKSVSKVCQAKDTRGAAEAIVNRANAIKKVPAKVRALEIARIVLKGAPHISSSELDDAEIQSILESEDIGLATFKKGLSDARKELAKKPKPSSPRSARAAKEPSPAPRPTKPYPPRTPPEGEPAYVENVDSKLL